MMKIEILGPGCLKCKQLTENVETALSELGLTTEIAKITDINAIINYGVMLTPALAIDGIVVSTGKVLTKDEIKKILIK